MITVLICMSVGLLAFYVFGKRVGDPYFMTGMGTMAGIAVGMVLSLALGFVYTSPDDFKEKTTTQEIVSLDSDISSSGSFFLGIGSVSGSKKYYYFVETPRGMNSRSVYATNSYINETDSLDPKVVHHDFQEEEEIWSFYIPAPHVRPDDYTEIYVPEGSIVREYNPN